MFSLLLIVKIIGISLYILPCVGFLIGVFAQIMNTPVCVNILARLKIYFLGFSAPLYLSQKIMGICILIGYVFFWQIFFSLGYNIPAECVLPKITNDAAVKYHAANLNESMLSLATIMQKEETPIDLSDFIRFKEHFSDEPFQVPSYDVGSIRGCLNRNRNLASSTEAQSLLDLLNDTIPPSRMAMKVYKADIEKFGIILQYHYQVRLDILIDGSASDIKKMEAFREIIRFIPLYLDFQIKSIDTFLDLIGHQTKTQDCAFGSVVDHVVTSTKSGKLVRGIMHQKPISQYDPYAAINVENCVAFFNSKIKPFLLAEVLEHKKDTIVKPSTLISGHPIDVWTGDVWTGVPLESWTPLTPSPFQRTTTSSTFVENVVDVSSTVEVSSQTSIVTQPSIESTDNSGLQIELVNLQEAVVVNEQIPSQTSIVAQPSIESDGDFMVNFGLQIEPSLTNNEAVDAVVVNELIPSQTSIVAQPSIESAVDAVQTTIVADQPSIESAVEGMDNSGLQIEPVNLQEAVDAAVIVSEQIDLTNVIYILEHMESELTDTMQAVIDEVFSPVREVPQVSPVREVTPAALPPARSFEGIERPPIYSTVNLQDTGRLKYQLLSLRNHNMELQVDLKHKYMGLGVVNMGIIGIGVYFLT